MNIRYNIRNTTVATTLALLSLSSLSFADEIYSTNGIAISGYDPISYFSDHRAVKGSGAFSATYNGTKFLFASADHRDMFLKDPQRYTPQFGGYCAYGTALGHKASTDPQAFTVIDDKLYLNYNQDVLKKWRQDPAGYIKQANQNWSTVKDEKFVP